MKWLPLFVFAALFSGCATPPPPPPPVPAAQLIGNPTAIQIEIVRRLQQAMPQGTDIDVGVDSSCVVTLFGFVQTEANRDRAVELATTTPGVPRVINDLRVLPTYLR